MDNKMIKISGLWKNDSKTGSQYLSGNVNGNCRYLILPNSYKKDGSNEPDFVLYMTEAFTKNNKSKPNNDQFELKSNNSVASKPFSKPTTNNSNKEEKTIDEPQF